MTPGVWASCAWVALGGALGALARFGVNSWVQARLGQPTFPWGTLVINVSGSFVLGLVATLVLEKVLRHPAWTPLVGVGLVGAYTTFSTFEYQTALLGPSWRALGNVLGSVLAGYAAALLGIRLAQMLAAHR